MSTNIVPQDRWSRWLRESRFGGDADYAKEYLDKLREVRDRVLDHRLKLGDGAVLLDVGAGDGLIGFGVLDRVGPTGRVIFSDVSRSLLEHCRSLAMAQIFTPEEAARYEAHVRPRVEAGHGVVREAVAYLAATKPERLAPTLPGRDGP